MTAVPGCLLFTLTLLALLLSACSPPQPVMPGGALDAPTPWPAATAPGTAAPGTAAPGTAAPGTPLPATLSALPAYTAGAAGVTGGIVLQNGGCCIGGMVNRTANLRIDLPAASAAGTVTEMRLRLDGGGCASESELAAQPWQPYQPFLEHRLRIQTLNWLGWYASVQYRDDQGEMSLVYCDDISVEGMPAPLAWRTGSGA